MRPTQLNHNELKLLYKLVYWNDNGETRPGRFFNEEELLSKVAQTLVDKKYCRVAGRCWRLPTRKGFQLIRILKKLENYLNEER